MLRRCPHCHSLLGVGLPRLKARILEAVERAGVDGIDADDLFDLTLAARGAGRQALKVHISQINLALCGSGSRIRGVRGRHASYRLIKVEEADDVPVLPMSRMSGRASRIDP